ENVHWFLSDGQTLWTVKGLEVLRLLQNTVAVKAKSLDATDTTATDATESVAPTNSPVANPLQRYTGFVEAVADALTPELLQEIDNAVTRKVKQAIATPMTATECVTLLTELGLKPCNPELLLSGNQPNLLPESKE
ncbi:MAG: DNA-binding protein, partial [Crinalium sp.]